MAFRQKRKRPIHKQYKSVTDITGCPMCGVKRGELCLREGREDGKMRIATDVHKGRFLQHVILRKILKVRAKQERFA